MGIASGFSHGLSGLQEGQAELQASVNLLGDYGCLSSLGFTLLLGGSFPRWVGRFAPTEVEPSPKEARPWGPDWASPESS